MVIKIFILGMLIGPVAIFFESFIKWLLQPMGIMDFIQSLRIRDWSFFVNIVLIAPIVEEFLKYQVVRVKVLKSPEFDEPLDVMLYLVIAALGFAAVENLLLIFQKPILPFKEALTLTALRFISATFVHALASGIIGYWVARSLREPAKKFQMLAKGFAVAIFFHSGYNFLTWMLDLKKDSLIGLVPVAMIFILISLMAILVSYNFSLLKKLHSICKICFPSSEK